MILELFRRPLHNNFHKLNATVIPIIGYLLIPVFIPYMICVLVSLEVTRRSSEEVNAITCECFR